MVVDFVVVLLSRLTHRFDSWDHEWDWSNVLLVSERYRDWYPPVVYKIQFLWDPSSVYWPWIPCLWSWWWQYYNCVRIKDLCDRWVAGAFSHETIWLLLTYGFCEQQNYVDWAWAFSRHPAVIVFVWVCVCICVCDKQKRWVSVTRKAERWGEEHAAPKHPSRSTKSTSILDIPPLNSQIHETYR